MKQLVNLNTLAGGALQEKFNMAFNSVLENLQDPNTPYADKRSITVKIGFSQNEQRDDAKVEISVLTKLAGVISSKTNFYIGKDLATGEIQAREYGKSIPGQMTLAEAFSPEEDLDDSAQTKVTKLPPRNLRVN